MELLSQRYGASVRPRVFRAPGRVNLIGEHTDYNMGLVLPVAIELACYTAIAPNAQDCLRVFSANYSEERVWPVDAIATAQPAHDWADYVLGVSRELVLAGYPVQGADLAVWSTIPPGSGLSSSAAIEVSIACALLGDRSMPPLELVKLCRRAENDFVGMPCGIMDQFICVFGKASAAVKIDCRSLDSEIVPLPAGVEIIAVNSMMKHELATTAYRQRVAECAAAVQAIQQHKPCVQSLRDVTAAEVTELDPVIPVVAARRALHVTSENERVIAFVEACGRGDVRAMGELFIASHRSLQKDYEVSCEELDFLVETALRIPGVVGARMTGGGFGGCTVNLLRPEVSSTFRSAVAHEYRARFGITPEFYPCRPSEGAAEVPAPLV